MSRIRDRWLIASAPAARNSVAVLVNLGTAFVAIACLLVLAPPSDWASDPILLGALALLSLAAAASEVRLGTAGAWYIDSSYVLALVALTFAGPLPALVVWSIPAAVSVLWFRRTPLLSPGVVVTISSYALAVLMGHGTLSLLPDGPVAVFTAGLVMFATNLAVTERTYAPFYEAVRARSVVRSELLALAPAVLASLGLGTLTWLLLEPFGVFALGLFAAVVMLPALALETLSRSGSVHELGPGRAAALYSEAIADVLGLSRRQRRVLAGAAAVDLPEKGSSFGGICRELVAMMDEIGATLRPGADLGLAEARLLAWMAAEPAEPLAAPRSSLFTGDVLVSVLAVARRWAAVTARGTAELSHDHALLSLRAASDLDPAVVAAAVEVVAAEKRIAREPTFMPILHRIPLPHPLRRRGVPAVAVRLAP